MKRSTDRKRVAMMLLTGLLAAGAGFTVAARPACSGESQPAPSVQTETGAARQPAEKPAAVPRRGAGSIIYIDPQTGELLKEPAPGSVPLQLTPALDSALSTSHQGLVEVPSSVPDGGVKVDLQGRFQSPLIGTIDANGKIKLHHLHETPEPAEKK